jgi:hypothetical protein
MAAAMPPPRTAWHPAEESRCAFGHPIQKRPQPIRLAQRRNGVKAAGEFGFGKSGVDFLVTDMMYQNDRPAFATFQPGHQMMQALRHIGWDGAQTQRSGRIRLAKFGEIRHLVSAGLCWHRMGRGAPLAGRS